MHDTNALPPLVIAGVTMVVAHRFVIVWPTGKISNFPEWEKLKNHAREEIRNGNPDVVRAKVFVCTKERMQVPLPET